MSGQPPSKKKYTNVVSLKDVILCLHNVLIAITKLLRTRIISEEQFRHNASSLVGKKVQIAGRIEPNLRETVCTAKRFPFGANAKLGDTREGNSITGNAKLVANITPLKLLTDQVELKEISLQGICCQGKEVITYKGGGKIRNRGGGSYLYDDERESALLFDSCNFVTLPLKIGEVYTVTGIVMDQEKYLLKKLDQYFPFVTRGTYISSRNRYYIMVTEIKISEIVSVQP